MIDVLMENFIEDVAKTIDMVITKLLCEYGITRLNYDEYKDRIIVYILYDLADTKRRFYLDNEYIGTVISYVDSDFNNLHSKFVVEIIYEKLEEGIK